MPGAAIGGITGAATPAILGLTATGPVSGGLFAAIQAAATGGAAGGGLMAGSIPAVLQSLVMSGGGAIIILAGAVLGSFTSWLLSLFF